MAYQHWRTKEIISQEDAYEYALEKCLHGEDHEEFKSMLVEWFFSGDYIEVEE